MTVADPEPATTVPARATRRNRVLRAGLAVLFAAWMAALLAMYFATVYPVRHPKGRPPHVAPPHPSIDATR